MHQQRKIADAANTAGQANRKAESTTDRVRQLESRCDKTLLVCEALWSLLRERVDLTDEELAERIVELDMKDGKLDGKSTRPPTKCGKCQRISARRFTQCLWCGADMPWDPFAN